MSESSSTPPESAPPPAPPQWTADASALLPILQPVSAATAPLELAPLNPAPISDAPEPAASESPPETPAPIPAGPLELAPLQPASTSDALPPAADTPSPVAAAPAPPMPDTSAPITGDSPPPIIEEQEEHIPFWNDAVFPWTMSAAVHLAIIFTVIFTLYLVSHRHPEDDGQQLVVPTSFGDPAFAGGKGDKQTPGEGVDPSRQLAQNHLRDILQSDGWAQNSGAASVANLIQGQAQGEDPLAISLGTGAAAGGAGSGGAGDGGPLAPYGTPGGGLGNGPRTSFYGTGGAATRIVYILDHSGSMIDNFDFLKREATKSVGNLVPVQFFSMIMVSESATFVGPDHLQRATNDTKQLFAEKIAGFHAEGYNDDLLPPFQDAFQKAFAMKPELIYFLTDGHFDPQLMGVIDRLNKNHKVRINTLAFVNHDASYEAQLQLLAKRNGGKYRFISAQDVAGGP